MTANAGYSPAAMPSLPTPLRYRRTPTLGAASVAALAPWGALRVVSWNLQFCGGRAAPFFYEGGSRVRVPRADQDRAFGGVVEVLRSLNADVVLLQELDRGSARTDHVDQLARLLSLADEDVAAFVGWAGALA